MSVSAAPSIFDVFNARQLSPQEVARSFVPPPHFRDLTKLTHTLILGPRGSGKTTLLKMLQPAALEAWSHRSANEYRNSVNFTGVFIATDINWNEQITSLGEGRLEAETHRHFAKAAFTTEILQALVESMIYRIGGGGAPTVAQHRRVDLEPGDESAIARELISAWHIDRAIPTLEGVKFALARRLSEIRVLASQEACRSNVGRNERVAGISFLHLDFLDAASVAVEAFNSKAKERDGRWALLFDELELAPDWIRSQLIQCLRSVDQRFLFKISLSPYSVDLAKLFERPDAAASKQDFLSIRLWYVHKEDGYQFCRELLASMLDAKGLPQVQAERIFGVSAFATDADDWSETGTAYTVSSSLGKEFQSLESQDHTFREYLRRHGIQTKTMHTVSAAKRAAVLRKTRSVVVLRSYFRGAGADLREGRNQQRRSRKIPTVYGGATSLFAMVEGNPRWFIGIVSELLSKARNSSVPKQAQVRQILESVDVFRAMLATIPCARIGKAGRGLLSLLDPVGSYFGAAAIDAPFDPDPPCSFVVDSRTSDDEIQAIGRALNAGAIVYAPEDGATGLLENLRGKRFRLSYILAPYYYFPLVLGRSVSLRKILASEVTKGQQEATLFSPYEEQDV